MSVTRSPSLLWSTLRKKSRPKSAMPRIRGAQSMADVSVNSWQFNEPVEPPKLEPPEPEPKLSTSSNPFQDDMSDDEPDAQNQLQAGRLEPPAEE